MQFLLYIMKIDVLATVKKMQVKTFQMSKVLNLQMQQNAAEAGFLIEKTLQIKGSPIKTNL